MRGPTAHHSGHKLHFVQNWRHQRRKNFLHSSLLPGIHPPTSPPQRSQTHFPSHREKRGVWLGFEEWPTLCPVSLCLVSFLLVTPWPLLPRRPTGGDTIPLKKTPNSSNSLSQPPKEDYMATNETLRASQVTF